MFILVYAVSKTNHSRDVRIINVDSSFIACPEMIALYSVFLFLAFRSNVPRKAIKKKILKKPRLFKAALYSSKV